MIRKSVIVRYKDLTKKERREFTDRFYRCWTKLFRFGDDDPGLWWDDMEHGFGYPWEYVPESEVEDPEVYLKRNWKDFVEDHIRELCNELNEEASEESPEARRKVGVEAASEDMYKALKQIAEMDPGEHEEELSHDLTIKTNCVVCEELIEIARKTLKKAGLLED